MTRRSISMEDDPEARVLSRIIKDPLLSARQIAADRLLIDSMIAARLDIVGLQKALDDGANPDRIVWNGHSALHVAVARRSVEALELLLKYDVSVEDVNKEGATALDEAHRLSFAEGIRMLEDVCATLNRNNPDGDSDYCTSYQKRINTELVQCAAHPKRSPRELETAIALGGEINPEDSVLPLFLAIASCSVEKTALLLQAGAAVHPGNTEEGTALAQLWHARDHQILSDEWRQLYAKIYDLGGGDIYSKPLDQFTVNDLRQPLGLPDAFGQKTVMHHLVQASHADFVLEAIARDPAQRLKAADFLKTAKIGGEPKTFLSEVIASNKLEDFLSVNVWQGRLNDLLALIPHVEDAMAPGRKIDLEPLVAAVREQSIRDLHAQAKSAPRFKGF